MQIDMGILRLAASAISDTQKQTAATQSMSDTTLIVTEKTFSDKFFWHTVAWLE